MPRCVRRMWLAKVTFYRNTRVIRGMQVSHAVGQVSAVFDDPNLVSCAGLAPVVVLAQQCGLAELVASRLTLTAKGGANAHLKIPALVGGMVAGADSINDMGLLRHGGMNRLFTGIRAPSTMGTFLRTFTFGHVRQLDAVSASGSPNSPPAPRCWPVPTRSPGSISTTPSGPPTATPSKAPGSATRGEGPERAARDRLHTTVGAGDRRHPAAGRQGELRPRRPRLVADPGSIRIEHDGVVLETTRQWVRRRARPDPRP
jgi:hypothetical protein